MSLLVDAAAKASVIVALSLCLSALLRNRSSALRHWVLVAGVLGAASVPVVQRVAPGWNLAASSPTVQQLAQWVSDDSSPVVVNEPLQPNEFPASVPLDVERIAGIAWAGGTAISLLILIAGLGRLSWLARRADRLATGPLAHNIDQLTQAMAIRQPVVLLQSHQPSVPITWGVLTPKIMVPAGAAEWSVERRQIVLLHELVHIQRRDWLTLLAAETLRAVYWFNPLMWLAARRLRQESERACDDVVLRQGVDGRAYAEHLLALARSAADRGALLGAAPAMVRRSGLERRVRAMLNDHLNRRPLSRVSRLGAAAGAVAVTMAVGGYGTQAPKLQAQTTAIAAGATSVDVTHLWEGPVRPGVATRATERPRVSARRNESAPAQTFSSLSGTVFDATNNLLPGVTLTLVNEASQASYEVFSDASGRFEFVGLSPGDYTWRATLPGFRFVQYRVTIAAQSLRQDLTLQLGTLAEAVTIRAGRSDAPAQADSPDSRPPDPRRELAPVDQRLGSCDGGLRVGGVVRAPTRIRDVTPRYPADLANAGIGGVVILEAIIDPYGDISSVALLKSVHPGLDQAAVDAVRQWRFTPTRLNCTPVEILYNVTATFVPAPQ